MTKDILEIELTPTYFRLKKTQRGWLVEIRDPEGKAMGVVSKNMEPLAFESEAEAELAAKARGLLPLPPRLITSLLH